MRKITSLLAALCVAGFSISALAASLPYFPGPIDPGSAQSNMNAIVQSVNAGAVGFGSLSAGKNYLDNGDMFIAQRGTGVITGASTGGCVGGASPTYDADRWCIVTNVTSGAGRGQVITATPSPPVGFQNSMKCYRNSGALTQQVQCVQEIESSRFTQLQGKTVIASCYVQPLAGLTSANGAIVMNLVTGTGSDEGLGTWTASPAITPAFTGVATQALTAGVGSPSFNLGTTAAWSRIYSAPVVVPVAATEGMFSIGFVPVGSASGTTDGFAYTGCMLEASDPNQTAPSAYEFLPPQQSLARAQRFYWQVADPAATVEIPSACFVTAANTTVKCGVWLPQVMRAAPTTVVTVATSFGIVVTAGTAGTCTTLAATASSNSTQSIGLTCTTGGTIALGSATPLIGAATAGVLAATADF